MAWSWVGTRGTASIADDTAGGTASMALDGELADDGLTDYVGCALDDAADIVCVDFSSAPSAPDKATVEATVAAHTAPAPPAPNVFQFGADYQSVNEAALTTTTSASYQVKASLATPVLTGTYRVAWQAVVEMNSISTSVSTRLRNTTAGANVGAEQVKELKDLNDVMMVGGVAEVVFDAESIAFELQWHSESSDIAGIQDARIEIWRVK